MARLKQIGVATAALLAALILPIGALGVLYLLRGPTASWPGPTVKDALPLDELAHHDAVKLIPFLVVWVATAILLAGMLRLAGMGRLLAALVLLVGVGAWIYLLTGVSLYVVRGLSRPDILHGPAHVRAVYVEAGLCGLAGAVLGRRSRLGRGLSGRTIALLVGAAGLLDIVSAITPEIAERLRLVETVAPLPVPPLASAVVVPVGLVLLLTARGLARGKRRAWQIAVVLLAGSSLLHLLKGLDFEEALVTGSLALVLFARRDDFAVAGDPQASPRVLARLGVFAAAVYAYGVVALWLNQQLADRPFTIGFAMSETSEALVGLTLRGSSNIRGSFGGWFPLSVLLIGAAGAGSAVAAWLAPWRYRHRQEVRARRVARTLVASWGDDTLSPFVLRADKSYVFDPDERAMIAYTVVGGVAIVSGEPIGPPDRLAPLVREYIEFAHGRDWRVAALGVGERRLDLYAGCGLRALYHGDEAVIDIPSFSLEGRPIRKVRQAVHRLERAGYQADMRYAKDVDPLLRSELESILRQWRGREPQKGFVMTLDSLDRLEGNDAMFAIGRDADGAPAGFLHFAVTRSGSALSLSSMPRRAGTPNGFNEWLICGTIRWAVPLGFQEMSLNFSPFAAILDPQAELSAAQRLERHALLAMKSRFGFQLDNLLMFSGQFRPRWERRYVLYERWTDLPRVGVAALRAEGYLPFGGGRTGPELPQAS